MHRPTVSKSVGHCFEPLKTFIKKKHVGNAFEHLRCVISSNWKRYHSCNLGEWKNSDDKEIQTSAGCASTYKHLKNW